MADPNASQVGVNDVIDAISYAANKEADLMDRVADSHLRRIEQSTLMLANTTMVNAARVIAANPTS